ncbi:unnamed protein product, partial [Effrenium voratum]
GRPGSGFHSAQQLERAGGLEVAQLVIWATLDNDLPQRTKYVEICQQLSPGAAQQIMLLVERFSEEPGTPAPATPTRFSFPGSSPSVRTELPDFLELGLDAETRFRRLKEHYIALKEDQERWEEERQRLIADVEAERKKRVDAEEQQRVLKVDLRLAEEQAERAKEDQRTALEMKLEQEMSSCQQALRRKDQDVERLREELDVAKSQAIQSQKWQSQVEMLKKKLEECQAWKREKEELRKQLDEIASQQAGSTMEHLHGRLAQLREDVQVVSRERDQAQMQVKLLQTELASREAEDTAERPQSAAPHPDADAARPAAPSALAREMAPENEALRAAKELQSQLALRERELQAGRGGEVLQWRSQAESSSLQAQETLMASAFHELGLRYHQLQVQHSQLKRQLGKEDA